MSDRMESRVTALSDAKVGSTGTLESIDLTDEVSNYLAHLGFLPGAGVEVLRRAPAGDPTVYGIDGMEIALRHETAESIRVRPAEAETNPALPEADQAKAQELLEAAR